MEFCGDLVYKLKKIVDTNIFSTQFSKMISHYKSNGYNFKFIATDCVLGGKRHYI